MALNNTLGAETKKQIIRYVDSRPSIVMKLSVVVVHYLFEISVSNIYLQKKSMSR